MDTDVRIYHNDWYEKKRHDVSRIIAEEFNHSSIMASTNIIKIVLNAGVGKFSVTDKKFLENTFNSLNIISFGQKPVFTYAKKSIINFKIREGMPIGCKLTLRKKNAWDFLFDFINVALPAIPNFRGISEDKFDKFGNYNVGINNLNIFPTIPFDLTFRNQGLQITFVFKSKDAKENIRFLNLLNFPFAKKK